jgi:hypothetical protein
VKTSHKTEDWIRNVRIIYWELSTHTVFFLIEDGVTGMAVRISPAFRLSERANGLMNHSLSVLAGILGLLLWYFLREGGVNPCYSLSRRSVQQPKSTKSKNETNKLRWQTITCCQLHCTRWASSTISSTNTNYNINIYTNINTRAHTHKHKHDKYIISCIDTAYSLTHSNEREHTHHTVVII